jgi:hypothetical protein
MNSLFVLIHSPLVGPSTWIRVADLLRKRGHDVVTPALAHPVTAPFWPRHVEPVAAALADRPAAAPVVLVGHSGAGPLLPAMAQAAARPVAALLFVDAGMPAPGLSRLEMDDFGPYLRALYGRGERFPNWRDEDLRDLLPDPAWRARLLAELRPQPLAFWEEPLPTTDLDPATPGAYLQFTSSYDEAAARARRRGWPYRHLPAGHFHMLVDPQAAADAILDLVAAATRTPGA